MSTYYKDTATGEIILRVAAPRMNYEDNDGSIIELDLKASSVGVQLMEWGLVQSFQVISATRDSNSTIITANIRWPDGTLGVFTTDVASVDFPGAIDAWHATYLGSPTKTITQPLVTRDVDGAVIAKPAITIT